MVGIKLVTSSGHHNKLPSPFNTCFDCPYSINKISKNFLLESNLNTFLPTHF